MLAVTLITPQTLASVVNAYALGDILSIKEEYFVPAQRWWDVRTRHGHFLLRMTLGEGRHAAAYEAALLRQLGERALPVPMRVFPLVSSLPVEVPEGRFELFVREPGRRLGAFEVTSEHLEQVGRLLGAVHVAGRGLPRRRVNPLAGKWPLTTLVRTEQAWAKRKTAEGGPHPYLPALKRIVEQARRLDSLPTGLPRGIIHGQPGLERFRFLAGKLTQLQDFSSAGSAPLVFDLGLCVAEWAFVKDELMSERIAHLTRGYESRRPLAALEREALFAACQSALIAVAARIVTDPHHAAEPAELGHVLLRMQALREVGPRAFARLLGGPLKRVS